MSNDNLVMEEGDIVFVPETPSTVTVAGAVTVQSAILHVPGKTVAYYVERSGGLVIDAAKDRVLIIRAGGEVIRANARTKVELGDYILVPTKVMAERLTDKQAEIDTISKNVTSLGSVRDPEVTKVIRVGCGQRQRRPHPLWVSFCDRQPSAIFCGRQPDRFWLRSVPVEKVLDRRQWPVRFLWHISEQPVDDLRHPV